MSKELPEAGTVRLESGYTVFRTLDEKARLKAEKLGALGDGTRRPISPEDIIAAFPSLPEGRKREIVDLLRAQHTRQPPYRRWLGRLRGMFPYGL